MEIELPGELNVREFAIAKRDIALGNLSPIQWEDASPYQQGQLHQIELLMKDLIKKKLIKIL